MRNLRFLMFFTVREDEPPHGFSNCKNSESKKRGVPSWGLDFSLYRQRRHNIGGIQICDLVGGVSFGEGDGGNAFSFPADAGELYAKGANVATAAPALLRGLNNAECCGCGCLQLLSGVLRASSAALQVTSV